MSNKPIIAVDAGNGLVKAVYQPSGKGSFRPFIMPSIRARYNPTSLGTGRWEANHAVYTWHNATYVMGQDVLKLFNPDVERHIGTARYTGDLYRMLVAGALANLGVPSGAVSLMLCCPPKMWQKTAPRIVESFHDPLTIALDGKEYLWNCAVDVYPEGFGAAAVFFLDGKGREVDSDLLTGNTLLIDIGAYTVDTLVFTGAEIDLSHLNHATYSGLGLHRHILEPVLNDLQKADSDYNAITTDHVDYHIRLALSQGGKDFTVKVGNKAAPIGPRLTHYAGTYANALLTQLLSDFNSFDGINHVLLTGGGAYLVQGYFQQALGGKLIDPSKYAHARNVGLGDYNAFGMLRIALNQELGA